MIIPVLDSFGSNFGSYKIGFLENRIGFRGGIKFNQFGLLQDRNIFVELFETNVIEGFR